MHNDMTDRINNISMKWKERDVLNLIAFKNVKIDVINVRNNGLHKKE